MNEVLVVGNRILEDSADPMKIVIPSLYGVQCFAWCGSLACIAVTRAAASDPTLGFEIQDPKIPTHRLEMQQWMNRRQSVFGFRRPSTVSPFGSYGDHGTKLSGKVLSSHPQQDTEDLDGQRIIIPNNRRISQVVVTFRSDLDGIQMDTTKMSTEIHAPEAAVVSPQRSSAIYVTNHNYSLNDPTYTSIPFTLPGESLSDMIFNAVPAEQPITRVPPSKAQEGIPSQPEQRPSVQSQERDQEQPRPSESSNRSVSTVASTTVTKKSTADSKADLATLSSSTTLDEGLDAHGNFELENEAHPPVTSILSKDQVQQLEKMQQQRQYHQSTWQLLMEQDRKQNMEKQQQQQHQQQQHQQQVQHVTFPIVPTRRSSFNNQYYEKEMDFSLPAIQSNSSDPSECISTTDGHISATSVILSKDQPPSSPVVSPVSISSRSKSGMLKYWKKNRTSDSSLSSEESSVHGYFSNAFSKKAKPKHALMVPSIVLHPDEEDGEPPRVLSQKDIEYLSTAPPVPLRPLIQPWDDPEEGHDGYGDGYDYDYDYDSYHQGEDEEEEEEEEEEESEEGDEEQLHHHHQLAESEYDDPYALDVPINLEIDLQGLEHGEVKGYGYI
ncbi:hypothetical protein CPB97_011578 [Podila verticillata]|nr:hypothetical protein CPB97_011578 [Podila verticillata]